MASTDAKPFPIKNAAYRISFPILDADGDLVTGAASLDSEISKDGGTFADCTNEATEIATSSGMYYLDLTATEMNADTVAIIVKTSTSGAKTTPIVMYPAEDTDIPVNVKAIGGTAQSATDLKDFADSGYDPSTHALAAAGNNAIADQVWDELLTGATHNVATSAGRRLREAVDVMLIHDGTCQAGGGNDEVILDAGASAVNDFYINDLIVLTGGTGAGQQRHIDSYVGATKTATVNRDWSTNPDATTIFSIKADSTKHVHGFETAAKAEIESEVNDTLVALKLDHLVAVADSDDPVNDSIIAKLAASDGDWSGFDKATDALEALRDRGDAAWAGGASAAAIADAVWDELQSGHTDSGSFGRYLDTAITTIAAAIGSGLLSCTWTQKDGSGNPMDNVQIWITTDEAGSNVVAGALYTNTAGEVTFMLDAGTYYVWREKGGYNFTSNPQTWTVS